jgi:hypothetical protein
MSSMTRVLTLAVAALLVASCKPTTPAPAATRAAQTPRSQPARPSVASAPTSGARLGAGAESLSAFAARIGVECSQEGARLACIGGKPENGDIYDVELRPDCGPDGFFGGVAAETGAELRDALPPKDEASPAVLAQGQLVCIQAVAGPGQDPSYFYVVAVPVADVPACRGNRLCVTYGDRAVAGWKGHSGVCHIAADKRTSNACPQGWARREDIEDFSNGM